MGDSSFFIHKSGPVLRIINPEKALTVNLPTAYIVTKTSISFTYPVASGVGSTLPLAVVTTVGSLDLMMVSLKPE